MAESEIGTILDVEQVSLGSALAADAASTATAITVEDASDFDAENGGTVSINGATYTYTVTDVDNGGLTLGSGLVANASAFDRVDVWDTAKSAVAVEYRATVQLAGDVDNADAVDARVGSAVVPLLSHSLGVRDPGTGESCHLERQGGELVVTDLVGGVVQVDGERLVPPVLVYSGTPDTGSLILAISDTANTDDFDNAFAGGMTLAAGAADGVITFLNYVLPDTSDPTNAAPPMLQTLLDGFTNKMTGLHLFSGLSGTNAASIDVENSNVNGGSQAAARLTCGNSSLSVQNQHVFINGGTAAGGGGIEFGSGAAGLYYAVEATYSQSAADTTATTVAAISKSQEGSDYTNPWSGGTFTAPVSGWYDASIFANAVPGSTRLQVQILRSGSMVMVNEVDVAVSVGTSVTSLWLTSSDTFTFKVLQTTGSTHTVTGLITVARRL